MAIACNVIESAGTEEIEKSLVYISHADPVAIVITSLTPDDVSCQQGISSNGTPVPLDDVTRVTLKVGDVTLDSDTDVGVFDWTQVDTNGDDMLIMRPGLALTDPVTVNVRLTIYSTEAPAGVVWINESELTEPTLCLEVRAA